MISEFPGGCISANTVAEEYEELFCSSPESCSIVNIYSTTTPHPRCDSLPVHSWHVRSIGDSFPHHLQNPALSRTPQLCLSPISAVCGSGSRIVQYWKYTSTVPICVCLCVCLSPSLLTVPYLPPIISAPIISYYPRAYLCTLGPWPGPASRQITRGRREALSFGGFRSPPSLVALTGREIITPPE